MSTDRLTPVTAAGLEQALAAAASARSAAAASSAAERAGWLLRCADALEASADELVALAASETSLPEARLRGELGRTSFQARLFADRLASGELLDVRVDPADDTWGMGPRADLRRTAVPIGPVLVFAASNFPFAFSVFGGDTVSALAAGCPVVVKAHPGHPALSRRVAALISDALESSGAPAGLLGLVEGEQAGVAAVQDPRIRAVGFTGSTRGGRFLFDLATSRPDPIPFYGELGSTNPVVVTPRGWATRADEIAEGFAGSFTLGAGQFCTKPGVLFVPDGDDLLSRVRVGAVHPMLTEGIRAGFEAAVDQVAADSGAERHVLRPASDVAPEITLLTTETSTIRDRPALLEAEMFGPAALVVTYSRTSEVLDLLADFAGSLTGSVQAADDHDEDGHEVVRMLAQHVGRVVWNQWPTGVTVSDAQNHGGPWPSSTAPLSTSVGTAAVRRFLRPVAYQNVPAPALPPEVRD